MSATEDILDCTDFVEINQNNYQIIKSKATKIGYSDGVSDGRQSVFQQGFDKGYKDGLTTAFNLKKYKFFFENLNSDQVNHTNLTTEKDEFLTLKVKELKSLQTEGSSLNSGSQDYIKKSLDKFAQKLPVATELLNVQSSPDCI